MVTTPTTIRLKSFGGEIRDIPVVQLDSEGFVVRWGFLHYTLNLRHNQLMRMHGSRVQKRLFWRADDIEALRSVYKDLTHKQ
jgi:hypothetical protein